MRQVQFTRQQTLERIAELRESKEPDPADRNRDRMLASWLEQAVVQGELGPAVKDPLGVICMGMLYMGYEPDETEALINHIVRKITKIAKEQSA